MSSERVSHVCSCLSPPLIDLESERGGGRICIVSVVLVTSGRCPSKFKVTTSIYAYFMVRESNAPRYAWWIDVPLITCLCLKKPSVIYKVCPYSVCFCVPSCEEQLVHSLPCCGTQTLLISISQGEMCVFVCMRLCPPFILSFSSAHCCKKVYFCVTVPLPGDCRKYRKSAANISFFFSQTLDSFGEYQTV